MRIVEERCQRIQEALGRIEARQLRPPAGGCLEASEFKVFSQFGEDGILQHLIREVFIPNKVFIEFGVENYTESNTRFLLVNDNWAGLVIDGGRENVEFIKSDAVYWRYNLKAEQAFITRENINEIIRKNGIGGPIGLLSIDIDGNDYWVWEAIDIVTPSVMVVEYNSRFGPDKAVTVPYKADFTRSASHYSNIYYGASLAALCLLGSRKGYSFVGCNTAGNNAFFVRSELKPEKLAELTPKQGFVRAKFRESRDQSGALSFLTEDQEEEMLRPLPVVEIS
jgi:hypothetical protein